LIAEKRRIWGWYAFDWASQPFYTLLLTFIFGPYFTSVAAEAFLADGLVETVADAQAQSLWSAGQTLIGLSMAIVAPILGAVADSTGRRMPWIVVFSVLYVAGTTGLWWTVPDGSFLWGALLCFGIGMIGAEFATIFTNAILPSLGKTEDIGPLSGTGFAIGYTGGLVALVIMLLFFAENEMGLTLLGQSPALGLDGAAREGTRFVGPFVALWYLVFMIPFFLWVKEPRLPGRPGGVSSAMNDLWTTIRSLPRRRSLAAYLASSMFYRDALVALYGFGGVYATLVLDWSITAIGVFGIVGGLMAAVFTFIGGRLDGRLGPKPVIVGCIWILIAMTTVIVGMSRETLFGVPLAEGSNLPDIIFYVIGAVIGATGGILQSASRTMMVRHARPDRPTEAFGLYALSGKATAFLAPGLIAIFTYVLESARFGVSPLILLFLLGLGLLAWVDADGDRAVPWSDAPEPA